MFNFILDFLFPKKCLGCDVEGNWLCDRCFSKITQQKPVLVRFAGSPLQAVLVCGEYRGVLKEAIHAFKYDGIKELAEPLSQLFIKALASSQFSFLKKGIFVPIPLFTAHQNERGFNQSEILVNALFRQQKIKIENSVLFKTENTQNQMKLKKAERLKNLKGAFEVKNKLQISGEEIVLVDDVMTTGATLFECAKVLHRAGAKRVFGLVLAR